MFGAANQLMAGLSLLIVTVWLKEQKKNPAFTLWPTIFMYITTLAATYVTARNLYVTIVPQGGIAAAGAWAMIIIAILLFIAALFIGWDGYQAYQRYAKGGMAKKAPAPIGDD
jgi:carbon starvation protein